MPAFSCIYERLGEPENFRQMMVSHARPGMEKDRDEVLRQLIDIQYDETLWISKRGTFRVRGDTVEVAGLGTGAIHQLSGGIFGDEIDQFQR